jgi:hypothetical protein
MSTTIRLLRGLSLLVGVLLIALGVVAAAYGAIRMSFLAETTGLVTEAFPPSHSNVSDSRTMFYRYAVDGTNYSGIALLRLGDLQDSTGRLNRTIRVFYKKGHPFVSYAVYSPSLFRWLRFCALVGMIGLLGIVLSRTRLHLTNRSSRPRAVVLSSFL